MISLTRACGGGQIDQAPRLILKYKGAESHDITKFGSYSKPNLSMAPKGRELTQTVLTLIDRSSTLVYFKVTGNGETTADSASEHLISLATQEGMKLIKG